jgi:YVTN family beta-propeller protein
MAEVPSGAVTFLFTDIEGSTRLVKQLRDRYGAVLSEHQRLVRAAFAAHRGYEVDTQGDAFFVAFASARDAVLAAVEAQRALAAHRWPDGVEIKVRMGLHTGQADAHDGRYTGLAVHRAARIGAAAHGGQILVSQATQTLLEDEEEDLHVSLRDLGDQQLKDLDRRVRLYQAVAEGLIDSFPPVHGGVSGDTSSPMPWWRRPAVLVTGSAAVATLALVAVLVLRPGPSGVQTVQPNHLGVIDPRTNDVVAQVPVGISPGPVAVGGNTVWVGNLEDRTLTSVDPVERTSTGTVPLDGRTPTGVAEGLGSVWVAHGLRGGVSRIDPEFRTITGTTAVGGSAFGSPNGTLAIDRTSVWAAFGDSTLAQINAQGETLGQTLAGTQPAGVAVGEGAVWVANAGDSTVYRFHPGSFAQGPVRSVSVGRQPTGIAVAPDAVWVANSGDGTVSRIDPTAYSTVTIPVADEPVAVAVSPDAVWVASRSGVVSRIDPEANEVVAEIELESALAGIAAGLGYVWVTAQEASS